MKTFPFALLVCPFLLFACGAPQKTPRPSKASSSNSDVKGTNGQGTASNSPHRSQPENNSSSEAIIPPQQVTGIFLSCAKPDIVHSAMNIDCILNNPRKERVKAADIADSITYGVDSTVKDDDVLISTVTGKADLPYDVRYVVMAKDLAKIEKIVDSSTFFAKAFNQEGQEIKDAVKPFFGIDLEFPTLAEMKEKFASIPNRFPF